MITTINNEHKKLNFSSEREQSQACLNSAEHEKNQGRKVLNVPNKREQNQTCLDSAEREGLRPKGNVPNLRFPEFQGEWISKTIGDIAPLQRGFDLPTGKICNGKIPVVYSNGIMNHHSSYKCVAPGLVTGRSGTIGKFTYIEDGYYWPHNTSLWVTDFHDNNPKFIYYLYQTIHIEQYSTGSGVPTLNRNNVHRHKTFIPKLKEQNKIAAFLSLLDERIATQSKIIDKLQSLIKGIVDCTILRKEKNAIVGDVCSISEQIRAEANIDDIITVRLHGNGVCKSSAENLQLGATQYYRRRAGQLIYGKQNFHNGAIGIVPISLDNGITSKDIPSFDIDEMKCNSVYLLAQLQSPQYYKPAEALTTGTGSKRLKEETFLKMPIVLPNKREQDNIAVLIHRASMNLDHAKRLLELLSIQKQFLLRQMFI